MKNLRSGFSNILVLIFLVGLAVVMVAIFNSQNLQSAGLGSSPIPTAVGTHTSPLATPATNVPPARIGKPVVLQASGRLGQLNQASDKIVNATGENGTILLDPTSGLTRTLAITGLINAHASNHWLVYEDRPPLASAAYYSRIKIVDLNNGTEIVLGNQTANQQDPQISGNYVVWIDWRNRENSGVDIYGYDLTTGKEFPIITNPRPNSGPKISGTWMVYLEPTDKDVHLAELRAHSLVTHQDFSIGIIPSPNDARSGTFYAIDGDKVAWVKNITDGQYELHLYDVAAKTDRQLTGTLSLPPSMLSLSAKSGIVTYYDEARRSALDWFQPTPVPLSITAPVKSQWGYDLSTAGDYLVWRIPLNRESSNGQIIVTKIMR